MATLTLQFECLPGKTYTADLYPRTGTTATVTGLTCTEGADGTFTCTTTAVSSAGTYRLKVYEGTELVASWKAWLENVAATYEFSDYPGHVNTSGYAASNPKAWMDTALTDTSGQSAASMSNFWNQASPTGTVNSLPSATPGASGGLLRNGSNGSASFATLSMTQLNVNSGATLSGGVTINSGLTVNAVVSGGNAVTLNGAGSGDGLHAQAGGGGRGIHARGGASSGDAIYAEALAGNGNGMTLVAHGTGLDLNATTTDSLQVDMTKLGSDAQSATDLKDFADAGYDPSTNKVQGVVLVDTLTTYTGNTPQTGDNYARLGAPAGASIAADIAAIEAQTDDIGVAGAGLTALASAANLATLTGYVDTEIAAIKTVVDSILVDTAEIGAAGAGLTALATQASVNTVDTVVDAIKAVTDLLPDAGALTSLATASALATVDANVDLVLEDTGTTIPATLATIAGYIDTEVAAALAAVDTEVAAIKAVTDLLPDSGALTSIATASALATVDTVVDAVKVVTDKLDTALELDGAVYRYTTNALEQGPTGTSLDAAGVRAAVGLASANLDTQLADLPTVAEFEARTLPTADYFNATTDTVTVGTNNDKTGYSITGTLTTLDALDTAQDSQHATTQAAITALNDLSTLEVQTIVADAFSTNDPPTFAEMTAAFAALNDFDPATETVKLASDGLDAITVTAPSGVPTTFREMLVMLYRRFFAKVTKDSDEIKTYADNGTTVLTTQTYTSSGSDETVNTAT